MEVLKLKYKGWKAEARTEIIGDRELSIVYFTDENGHDWYALVDKIDRLSKYIIGVNDDNTICWVDTSARAKYSPPIGGMIILLDELPEDFDNDGSWEYKGGELVKIEQEENVSPRTKEELMAELEQIKKELGALQ